MSAIIFYGAGQNLCDNFTRWYNSGLHPVCIVDANTSMHNTVFSDISSGTRQIEILPLLDAIELYPDYTIYITLHQSRAGAVADYLTSFGINADKIRHCDNPDIPVSVADGAAASYRTVFPSLQKIFYALQDDLSRLLFLSRVEYSLTHSLASIYKAMADNGFQAWVSSKSSIANERYGLKGLWELLKNNYTTQSNDIYLYCGHKGAFEEWFWILERFLEAVPKLGIKISGCIMHDGGVTETEYLGMKVISDEEFLKLVTENTRLIIGFPGWCLQTKEIVDKYSSIKDILIPIADGATPQYFESDILIPQENEIFVDVGVLNFGDSINFVKWADKGYEKIYAFEPDPKFYEVSLKSMNQSSDIDSLKVELVNKGLSSKDGILAFPKEYNGSGFHISDETIDVEVVSLDSFLEGRRVSFIKMDIEGAEMDALLGMPETIKKWKPKLAICIYHKHEDVFEISSYILGLVPEYKFYIRHYNSNETEEVLLCTII